MNNYRTTARVVGSIYPAGFVFGIGGNFPIQSVLGEPDRLAALSATSNMAAMGALLWLLAVIGKAVHGSLSAIMGSSLGNVACNGSMPFRVERNDLISSWPERTDGRADG